MAYTEGTTFTGREKAKPKVSTSASTVDKSKQQKFFRAYKAGLLDDTKITNDGWKSLYEYELEKGYSELKDLPSDIGTKYGVDTSIGIKKSIIEPIVEPTLAQTTPTKEDNGLLSRLFSLLGNNKGAVPKYQQDLDSSILTKPTPIGSILDNNSIPKNQQNLAIPKYQQDVGIKPRFGNMNNENDPLIMALQSKLDPGFMGQKTKDIMSTINNQRFNKQRVEQGQLNSSGIENPFLSDGVVNPNYSNKKPIPQTNNANQPFLSDGTINPTSRMANDPETESKLRALAYGFGNEFIGKTLKRGFKEQDELSDQIANAIPNSSPMKKDFQQSVINRAEDREYWTEERMFNAFIGKPHDSEITKGEKTALGVGGFAGNLGKLMTFSMALGMPSSTSGMLIKNAQLGALSGAEGAYGRGEETGEIIKDALIGAGSFTVGELAGIGVTNKLTSQLVHTFKANPQWASHITGLVRTARGVADGTVGTIAQIGLSNVAGRETELELKDAIQSGIIMGVVSGVTSYIPWERFASSPRDMKNFNVNFAEVDDASLRGSGYIKLSEVEGANTNNPYLNDLYINPGTKDIVIASAKDGAFLVPKSMVEGTLDSETISLIKNLENNPIRRSVNPTEQIDYIDKNVEPEKYAKVLNSFMENEGYNLKNVEGEQVFSKYNKLNNFEGSWETISLKDAEAKFESDYFTHNKYEKANLDTTKVEPRTKQTTMGKFSDDYEVNRGATDSTSRQWVRDMQDKGYKEFKPGVWVQEVDGKIVDIVPEFTGGKNGKAIPVFDIKADGEVPVKDMNNTKGFLNSEYDTSDKSKSNPFIEYKSLKEYVESELKGVREVDQKAYDEFMGNIKIVDKTMNSIDLVEDTVNNEVYSEASENISQFLKNEKVTGLMDFFKNVDANVNPSTVANNMKEFNKEYQEFFFAEEKEELKENTTIPEVIEQPFNNGDNVEYTTSNGRTLEGTIISVSDDEAQIKATDYQDGKPVIVTEYVKLSNIKTLEDNRTIPEAVAEPINEDIKPKEMAKVEEVTAEVEPKQLAPGSKVTFISGGENYTGTIKNIDGVRSVIYVDKNDSGMAITTIKTEKLKPLDVDAPKYNKGDIVNYNGHNFVVGKTLGNEIEIVGADAGYMERLTISPREVTSGKIEKESSPQFIVGDKVTYLSNGKTVTGTIRTVNDEGEASINVNEISQASGVPIKRIEYVSTNQISKISEGEPIADNTTTIKSKATGYRDTTDEGSIGAGTFYWIGNGSDLSAMTNFDSITENYSYKKTEMDFNNLLEVSEKDLDKLRERTNEQGFSDRPARYLSELWGLKASIDAKVLEFMNDYKIPVELKGISLNDDEDSDEIEGILIDKYVAQEAIKRGYDGIKYGDSQLQDLRKLSGKPSKVIKPKKEEVEVEQVEETTSTNVGYHAGDLGKAEGLFQMTSGSRGTGHFGTGTYFVGDESKISSDTYKDRPHHIISFDGYNLFKPKYKDEAEDLHDSLKFVNNYYSKMDLVEASLNADTIISEYEDNVDAIQNYDKENFEDSLLYETLEKQVNNSLFLTDDDIQNAEKKSEGDKVIYFQWLLDFMQDNAKYNKFVGKAESNFSNFKFDIKVFPDMTVEKAVNLIKEVAKEIHDQFGDDNNFYFNKDARKSDSPSTRFMKKLGYEGVDVRHLKAYDTVEYGSVIYDLKGVNNKPVEDNKPSSNASSQEDNKNGSTDLPRSTEVVKEVEETKSITLSDYGITIENAKTKSGTEVWHVKGNVSEDRDMLSKGDMGGLWYGGSVNAFAFNKRKYPTMESLEKAIMGKLSPIETESVKEVEEIKLPTSEDAVMGKVREAVRLKALDGWKGHLIKGRAVKRIIQEITNDYTLTEKIFKQLEEENVSVPEVIEEVSIEPVSVPNEDKIRVPITELKTVDVIEGMRVQLQTILSSKQVDDIKEEIDVAVVYMTNIDTNKVQQDFVKVSLEEVLDDDKLVKEVYNMIIEEVKGLKGEGRGLELDNRTNDIKTEDREQSEEHETNQVPGTKETGKTTELSGREGSTDDREDNASGRTTSTDVSRNGSNDIRPKSGEQGNVDTGSRGNGNERNDGEVGNFRITNEVTLHEGGKKTRYKNNVEAIKLVKQLDSENRLATLEEQKILAKYVGWGGITEAFYDDDKKWTKEYQELKELLTEDEYSSARLSRLNAHYTAKPVIDKMYQAVKRLGFKNGKILEPAVGSGNFFGLLPEEFLNSSLTAVELEPITGKIAHHLYPNANVNIMGYEKFKVPNNFYDLIISNVPFGKFKVNDKDYNHLKFSIHNYYFAKSLDKVKEGGIVAFVTSHYTMDSTSKIVRNYIDTKAKLLGAIRLPNNAFSENAGTKVTTDIIFLQKLKVDEMSNNKWSSMSEINGVPVNEYYVHNPDMLLGTMVLSSNQYGDENETSLESDVSNISKIFDKAIKNLPENVFDTKHTFSEVEAPVLSVGDYKLDKYDKIGSIVIRGDRAYQVFDDKLELITQNKTVTIKGVDTKTQIPLSGLKLERIKGMIDVKVALRQTIDAQISDKTDKEINNAMKNLNEVYDAFVNKYGYISDTTNKRAFKTDADYQRISALEKFDSDKGKYIKSDVFTKKTIEVLKRMDKADNSIDGLGISLNETGTIDLMRIAELTGRSIEEVISDLKGIIYNNPTTGTYQTKDEYLGGNVKDKLRVAKAFAKDDADYNENVEALEAVQPIPLEAIDINIKLGQPWVESQYIQEFINELTGSDNNSIKVRYTGVTGMWTVVGTSDNYALTRTQYGTNRMTAEEILENLLNSKEIRVNVYEGSGNDRVLLKKESKIETTKAMAKSKLLVKAFKDFIFRDQDRREYLVNKYNDLFNNIVLREYDGSYLTFNGMKPSIKATFRDYQKSAVARIVFGGNTLLAHTVGAGKTYEMIAGAIELKRLGIANKPMFVVPNHLIEQWSKAFYELYPNANILTATKDDFTKDNRKRLFSMISNNNYDAVIVAHTSFGRIQVSKETQLEFMNEEINDVEQALIASKEAEGKGSRVTKQLEVTVKKLRERLEEINDQEQDNVITFEELGVDYLFVDEAHNFKNLFFYTKMSRIAGVVNSKAKRASDMYMKTRLISKLHNNKKGIVFATGTPVSNSIAEMFTMQRYLQMEKLKQMGISHFDAWANMFGDTVTKAEVDKTGAGFKLKTRFTDYTNVPELKKLFRSFADVIDQSELKKFLKAIGKGNALPELEGGKPITVQAEASDELKAYIAELVERSEAVEAGRVEPTEDNPLKITNDGRVSALDMRLIDSSYSDDPGSKLNLSVKNIYKEYVDGNKEKTTQLVFSDLGTPKKQKSKEQQLKERKIVKSNGYATYQWYYDRENEKKYVVAKINKETEEVFKLYEDGDELVDSLEDKNPDMQTYQPRAFTMDLDEYIESLGDGDEFKFEVKFDIYNDIRDKLVKMGVPRQEIAFIHEANTDLSKEKLFENVRNGVVRILLGSTAKMGEGMNVQDRLIALHHLDAPWKPSAIEQRNGRIVRFGNKHKTVRIYQYVTKGSFDSYLWSMLERKASFISKVMDSDLTSRNLKDSFDPVVLNASEVKALASDNPRIKEKFDVDGQIESLEIEKQAHRSEQYTSQSSIQRIARRITLLQQDVEVLQNSIKTIQNTRGSNFKATINGKTYTERKEAGETIISILDKMSNQDDEVEVGFIGGVSLSLIRDSDAEGTQTGYGKIYPFGKETISYMGNDNTDSFSVNLTDSIIGNMTRIENLLDIPKELLETYKKSIENYKKEKVSFESQLGKPFEQEAELEKLLQRQAELDSELSLDKPVKEETEEENIEGPGTTNNRTTTRSSIPFEASIPLGRKGSTKIKPISEIAKDIERDFGVSISSKRYRSGKGAIGQFQEHSESIRVKNDNDIQTIAHELGHKFDKKYQLSTKYKQYINTMNEGLNLSDKYKEEEIPGEVIAEFVRLYLVADNKAQALSQDFYNSFVETLDAKDLKNLNKHREDILNWYGAELTLRGQSTIRSHTKKVKIPMNTKIVNAEMWVFDDLAPIRRLADTAEQYTGEKLKYIDNPYVLAMYSRRAGMVAKAQIVYAQSDIEGNIIGESLTEVLKDIHKEETEAFDDYLKVSHAITLHGYGHQIYNKEFTLEDMQLMKATYERDYTHFKEIAQAVYKWWNRFIEEWVVKAGFMKHDVWAELQEKYPTYVPNFRVPDDTKGNFSTTSKKGFGNQRTPIKRLSKDGNDADTYSVIESFVLYTDKIVKTQKKNEVGVAIHNLYKNVEGLGEIMTKITHESELHKFNAMDLKATLATKLMADYVDKLQGEDKIKADKLFEDDDYDGLMTFLTKKGFAGADIVDNTIDDIITFFTPRMFSTDSSVFTVVDKENKTHFYEVHDPLFLEAMLNLNDKTMDGITKWIGSVKRVFTNLTTGANPIFGLTSNIWADVPEAYAYGSYKNPFEFGVALGQSMLDLVKKDDRALSYYVMGGGLSSPISENRKLMTEMLNKLYPDLKKSSIKNMVGYGMGLVEQLNDTIESAPRLNEYTKILKEYGDTYEGRLKAMYEANELTVNFLRHGRIQSTILGQGVPFLNAGLQGMYKLNAEFISQRGTGKNDLTGDGGKKKDKKRFLAMLAKALTSITIFEIIQMIAYENDEDYHKLSPYIKDAFWLIKQDDGTFIRIRKPRALGMLFSTTFRRGFQSAFGDKDKAWEGFLETFSNIMLPPNPLTDSLASGIIAVGRNKSWSGSPIVPMRLQNLPPLEQYDTNTSEISKVVAEVLAKTTGFETSPKNLDYLVQQYTGIIGQIVLPMATENKTLLGSLKQKVTTDVAYSNTLVNDFYEKKEKLDEAYTTYNTRGKQTKDFDPVTRYRYNKVNEEMSDLWSEINDIKENSSLTLKEKQTQERAIRLNMMDIVSEENLKPTSYDEFKVLYNKGQDLVSKAKADYEATKTKPKFTKEEEALVKLYSIPVDGDRGELGVVNYQITQINKKRKLLETSTVSEANKEKARKTLDEAEKKLTDSYMVRFNSKIGIDINKFFK